jgi:DNA-binding GntR family transcriptional regulator
MQLTKLRRERAVDAVYEALRQGILSQLFKPGERLHIPDLAEKLGVSLTPVRHAIQMLTAEGLIENRPRSGTFVATLSEQDVAETFDIRCALECLGAESALSQITGEQVQRLHELLEILAQPVESDKAREAHGAANSELHAIILQASGNRRLNEIYESLNAHMKIARIHGSETDWRSRLEQEHREHQAIVAAVEERNVPKLQQALRDHISRAKNALISGLKKP